MSIKTRHTTRAEARRIARALKAAGYHTITAALCHDYVINISGWCEPTYLADRRAVERIIEGVLFA